jgi:hypothetical protein
MTIPRQNLLLALLSDPLEQHDPHFSYSIEYPLILLLPNHPNISKALGVKYLAALLCIFCCELNHHPGICESDVGSMWSKPRVSGPGLRDYVHGNNILE